MNHFWDRCPDCPQWDEDPEYRKPVVPSDGDWDADVVFVGEGPGREENNRRRCFVGKTGDELSYVYLPLAGLLRDYVYLTNTFKCHWADASDTPPANVISSCAKHHLALEIEKVNPKIVVLMGAVAASLVNDVDLELHHGIPLKRMLFGVERIVYVTYHPALGMHKSDMMQDLLDDFRNLKLVLDGKWNVPVNEHPTPMYARLTNKHDLTDILDGMWDLDMAIDTESKRRWFGYLPWCLTFSIVPGEGWMIREEDKELVSLFNKLVSRFRRIWMHNSPHDIGVLGDMGIDIDIKRVTDTMGLAYRLQRYPKGLKPLSFRLAGMRLRNFEEVVTPASMVVALEYLEKVQAIDWGKPAPVPLGEYEFRNCPDCKGKGYTSTGRGKKRIKTDCLNCESGKVRVEKCYRAHGLNQKLGMMLDKVFVKGKDVDIWAGWAAWEDQTYPVIEKLGHMPLRSIEYVDESEAVTYACGDSDATLRIGPILERASIELRRSYFE